jgi:hypothetical protein
MTYPALAYSGRRCNTGPSRYQFEQRDNCTNTAYRVGTSLRSRGRRRPLRYPVTGEQKNSRKLRPATEQAAKSMCHRMSSCSLFLDFGLSSAVSLTSQLSGWIVKTSGHHYTGNKIAHPVPIHNGSILDISKILGMVRRSRRHQRTSCSQSRAIPTSWSLYEHRTDRTASSTRNSKRAPSIRNNANGAKWLIVVE